MHHVNIEGLPTGLKIQNVVSSFYPRFN